MRRWRRRRTRATDAATGRGPELRLPRAGNALVRRGPGHPVLRALIERASGTVLRRCGNEEMCKRAATSGPAVRVLLRLTGAAGSCRVIREVGATGRLAAGAGHAACETLVFVGGDFSLVGFRGSAECSGPRALLPGLVRYRREAELT